MTRACPFLLAGVYALQLSSFTLDSDLIGVAFVANFAVLVLGGFRGLVIFNIGIAIFSLAAYGVVDNRLAPKFAGDSMVTQVRIFDFPKFTGSAVSLFVEPLTAARVPRRVRVSWYEPTTLPRLGDTWQLELRLRRPRGNSNPGTFDYEAWLFRERVGAIGYVVNSHRNHLLSSGELSATHRLRQQEPQQDGGAPVHQLRHRLERVDGPCERQDAGETEQENRRAERGSLPARRFAVSSPSEPEQGQEGDPPLQEPGFRVVLELSSGPEKDERGQTEQQGDPKLHHRGARGALRL